jgi:hypothetical protein
MNIFYLLTAMNLLKRHGIVGWIATNLAYRYHVFGTNIHQCTFVTEKEICRRIVTNLTNRCNVLGFNAHL